MGKLSYTGFSINGTARAKFDIGGKTGTFDQALLSIRGKNLGAKLLQEIEEVDNTVEIFGTATADSTCQVEPKFADACCYKEILSDDDLRGALKKALDKSGVEASKRYGHLLRKIEKYSSPCLWKDKEGWTVPELKLAMIDRGKLAYHIQGELTRGSGAEKVEVVWNLQVTDLGVSDAQWSNRPISIALVHELIHAWRWVTGRTVFHPNEGRLHGQNGYHEEAMTVGLLPYADCEFTENKFRSSFGEPMRTWYGPSTKLKTERAFKKYG